MLRRNSSPAPGAGSRIISTCQHQPRIHLNDRAAVDRVRQRAGKGKDGERELLLRLAAGPAKGNALADAAGQTRAAVWKRIDGLRAAGVEIDARPGRGYSLRHPLELLDAAAIRAQLPAAARGQLGDLEVAWSLDSTNSELLRRSAPAAGCLVLLSERQTGGRGRRGRTWASPLAAHLYLSLARSVQRRAGTTGRAQPGRGHCRRRSIAGARRARGVRLKWPNDLVVEDCTHDPAQGRGGLCKLGGLLVEGGGELGWPGTGGGRTWV